MVGILQQAPNFRAKAVFPRGEVKDIALSDYAGKYVVLFFYPYDFSFVCPTEVVELSRRSPEFAELGAQVIAVSCDSEYAHRAWSQQLGDLSIPLVADYSKTIAQSYGALLPEGASTRATFILDEDGIVQYASYHNPSVGRSIAEILRVLEAIRSQRLTPVEWKRGEQTL